MCVFLSEKSLAVYVRASSVSAGVKIRGVPGISAKGIFMRSMSRKFLGALCAVLLASTPAWASQPRPAVVKKSGVRGGHEGQSKLLSLALTKVGDEYYVCLSHNAANNTWKILSNAMPAAAIAPSADQRVAANAVLTRKAREILTAALWRHDSSEGSQGGSSEARETKQEFKLINRFNDTETGDRCVVFLASNWPIEQDSAASKTPQTSTGSRTVRPVVWVPVATITRAVTSGTTRSREPISVNVGQREFSIVASSGAFLRRSWAIIENNINEQAREAVARCAQQPLAPAGRSSASAAPRGASSSQARSESLSSAAPRSRERASVASAAPAVAKPHGDPERQPANSSVSQAQASADPAPVARLEQSAAHTVVSRGDVPVARHTGNAIVGSRRLSLRPMPSVPLTVPFRGSAQAAPFVAQALAPTATLASSLVPTPVTPPAASASVAPVSAAPSNPAAGSVAQLQPSMRPQQAGVSTVLLSAAPAASSSATSASSVLSIPATATAQQARPSTLAPTASSIAPATTSSATPTTASVTPSVPSMGVPAAPAPSSVPTRIRRASLPGFDIYAHSPATDNVTQSQQPTRSQPPDVSTILLNAAPAASSSAAPVSRVVLPSAPSVVEQPRLIAAPAAPSAIVPAATTAASTTPSVGTPTAALPPAQIAISPIRIPPMTVMPLVRGRGHSMGDNVQQTPTAMTNMATQQGTAPRGGAPAATPVTAPLVARPAIPAQTPLQMPATGSATRVPEVTVTIPAPQPQVPFVQGMTPQVAPAAQAVASPVPAISGAPRIEEPREQLHIHHDRALWFDNNFDQTGFPIVVGGRAYKSATAYYRSRKDEYFAFHGAATPEGWRERSKNVMREVLRAKFSDPRFRPALVGTNGRHIINDDRTDAFWGTGDQQGDGVVIGETVENNWLGKLLDELRNEIITNNGVVAGPASPSVDSLPRPAAVTRPVADDDGTVEAALTLPPSDPAASGTTHRTLMSDEDTYSVPGTRRVAWAPATAASFTAAASSIAPVSAPACTVGAAGSGVSGGPRVSVAPVAAQPSAIPGSSVSTIASAASSAAAAASGVPALASAGTVGAAGSGASVAPRVSVIPVEDPFAFVNVNLPGGLPTAWEPRSSGQQVLILGPDRCPGLANDRCYCDQSHIIRIDGRNWRGVDPYYAAEKARYARASHVQLRDVNARILAGAMAAKFLQLPALRQTLLATGNAPIVYNNTQRGGTDTDWYCDHTDSFWGISSEENGCNMLGRILMALRSALADGVRPDFLAAPESRVVVIANDQGVYKVLLSYDPVKLQWDAFSTVYTKATQVRSPAAIVCAQTSSKIDICTAMDDVRNPGISWLSSLSASDVGSDTDSRFYAGCSRFFTCLFRSMPTYFQQEELNARVHNTGNPWRSNFMWVPLCLLADHPGHDAAGNATCGDKFVLVTQADGSAAGGSAASRVKETPVQVSPSLRTYLNIQCRGPWASWAPAPAGSPVADSAQIIRLPAIKHVNVDAGQTASNGDDKTCFICFENKQTLLQEKGVPMTATPCCGNPFLCMECRKDLLARSPSERKCPLCRAQWDEDGNVLPS